MIMTLDALPDATRYIPATPDLLHGWCGPVQILLSGDWHDASYRAVVPGSAAFARRLDPMRPEVRDHLIRALSLPQWMRDTPGGLAPWQSAGLVACAAAGVAPADVFSGWRMIDADTMVLPWPGGARVWRCWS